MSFDEIEGFVEDSKETTKFDHEYRSMSAKTYEAFWTTE